MNARRRQRRLASPAFPYWSGLCWSGLCLAGLCVTGSACGRTQLLDTPAVDTGESTARGTDGMNVVGDRNPGDADRAPGDVTGPAAGRRAPTPGDTPGGPDMAPECAADATQDTDCAARNVILFIGDGMGPAYLEAAKRYRGDVTEPLVLESLSVSTLIESDNLPGGITDSAAAATALATGRRVQNGTISVDRGQQTGQVELQPLVTALEHQQRRGRRAGLITVGTPATDATLAAFGAHASSRWDTATIAADYLSRTRPDVLVGWSGGGLAPELARAAGYEVVESGPLPEPASADQDSPPVCGLYSAPIAPSLASLTGSALQRLSRDGSGFFLLVEHETTDTAGHRNDLEPALKAVLELDAAVAVALAWAESQPNTLIVVGADHETGGLTLDGGEGKPGVVPDHRFATTGHTSQPVRYFATGPGAAAITEATHLADLFPLLAGLARHAQP